MLDTLLLVTAVCLDSFIVSMAYGTNEIKVPKQSVFIIVFFGTFFLTLSLYVAGFLQHFLSKEFCSFLSFMILLLIGIISFFQSRVKLYLQKHKEGKLKFKMKEISFVIDVYIDETKADRDCSKVLTSKEAIYLAFALSLDSLASGLAYGMTIKHPENVIVISFVMGVIFIYAGLAIGKRLAKSFPYDLSWLSGAILIILAFLRII